MFNMKAHLIYTKGEPCGMGGNTGLSPGYLSTCHPIPTHEFHTTCEVKFNYVGGNLAHGTLGHVMAAQAMWLNIQCQ